MEQPLATPLAGAAPPQGVVHSFRSGQKWLARYRLERVLGHGGMGVVWLARDEELDLDVALKFLPELVVNDRASLSDLKKETRRTLELTHPHIVRTYDFVQDERVAGISMEYVDSDTLRNLRLDQPDGVFQCEQIAEWMRQLCQALHYAHTQAAIVHRDLKPANLMVNRKRQLKIADFGISRSLVESVTQMTRDGGVSGTLVYMSPQQLSGEPPSPLDDVYAVGATIYELLTTRPPFYAGDIAGQIHRKTPPSMTERRAALQIPAGQIPPRWEATVAACLAKEPLHRPQNTLEIAALLGLSGPLTAPALSTPAAGGSPGPASAAVPTVINAPATRRKPNVLLVAGASFAAAICALIVGSALFLMRAPKPAAPQVNVPLATPAPSPVGKAKGSLLIPTEPAQATVQIGPVRQPSTYPFDGLAPGPQTVLISAEGYETQTLEVVIEANKHLSPALVKLERSRGSLRLVSEPEKLAFEIKSRTRPGEQTRGETPAPAVELPVGDYEVTLTREGWPPQTRQVTVRNREEHLEQFQFIPGRLSLNSHPPGATIIDARQAELGTTPMVLEGLIPGPVKYTLKLAKFQPAEIEASVVGGQEIEPPLVELSKVVVVESSGKKTGGSHHKSDDDDDDDGPKKPGVKAKIAAPFVAVGKTVGGWFSKKPAPKKK